MGFFSTIFGRQPPPRSPSTTMHSSPLSTTSGASPPNNRRELLRVAIRSTLGRQGIPIAWLGAEVVAATQRGREPGGVHLRLLIRHWDPRLLAHAVAIQNSLIERIMTFDPLASTWLTGISWQFDLPDESLCPALPPAGSWTAESESVPPPRPPAEAGAPAAASNATPASADAADAGYPADVREDLARLLAIRDAELQRFGENNDAAPAFSRTQPMPLQ
jgi:hypothetical protein